MLTVGVATIIIGICFVVSVILTTLSVFLPNWIINSSWSSSTSGIVPYIAYSDTWFKIISVEMYIALALLLILCLAYPVLWIKRVQSNSYFNLLAVLSSSVFLLEVSTLIISLIYGFSSDYGRVGTPQGSSPPSLGVSAYLTIPSAIAMSTSSFAAIVAARKVHLQQADNNC